MLCLCLYDLFLFSFRYCICFYLGTLEAHLYLAIRAHIWFKFLNNPTYLPPWIAFSEQQVVSERDSAFDLTIKS